MRDFIRAKREDGRLRQFNLSLLITDGFMDAVKNDGDWPLVFPINQKEVADVDLDNAEQIVWRDWPHADATTSAATTAWSPAASTATSARGTCGT